MAEQLIFDWPAGVSLGPDDFFVSKANQLAFALVRDVATWPDRKLVLVGPKGSGKSHLARVFQTQCDAVILSAQALDNTAPPDAAIVIEDADTLPATAEEPLFHLHNHQRHSGKPLLLTARQPPARWPIALPDLASRMQATAIATIENPDDDLLTALILKLFTDRQITPPLSLAAYLARRIERSFTAAAAAVDALDRMAMREGKPVTQRMAAALLDKHPPETQ